MSKRRNFLEFLDSYYKKTGKVFFIIGCFLFGLIFLPGFFILPFLIYKFVKTDVGILFLILIIGLPVLIYLSKRIVDILTRPRYKYKTLIYEILCVANSNKYDKSKHDLKYVLIKDKYQISLKKAFENGDFKEVVVIVKEALSSNYYNNNDKEINFKMSFKTNHGDYAIILLDNELKIVEL